MKRTAILLLGLLVSVPAVAADKSKTITYPVDRTTILTQADAVPVRLMLAIENKTGARSSVIVQRNSPLFEEGDTLGVRVVTAPFEGQTRAALCIVRLPRKPGVEYEFIGSTEAVEQGCLGTLHDQDGRAGLPVTDGRIDVMNAKVYLTGDVRMIQTGHFERKT